MSLFPADIEEELDEEAEVLDTLKEYEIDFETGQLTGKIVEGKEALKTWIWLALKVPRYRHSINTWDYGNEIETLIGKGYSKDHTETEAERIVEECLMESDYIIGLKNFSAEYENSRLKISVDVISVFGNIEVEEYY